jgi:hypothetical protein
VMALLRKDVSEAPLGFDNFRDWEVVAY